MTHPGIVLRVRWRGRDIVVGDSDRLHYIGKLSGARRCLPGCLPDCHEHGWTEVFPGEGWAFDGHRDLTVELRPVRLADEPPDEPPGDDDTGPCQCPCANCSGCSWLPDDDTWRRP